MVKDVCVFNVYMKTAHSGTDSFSWISFVLVAFHWRIWLQMYFFCCDCCLLLHFEVCSQREVTGHLCNISVESTVL